MFQTIRFAISEFLRKCQPAWRTLRSRWLVAFPRCAACGSTRRVEVHHVVPAHVDPSRVLDPENLISLCRLCHFVFGHLLSWRSWNEDVRADAAAYRRKVDQRPTSDVEVL